MITFGEAVQGLVFVATFWLLTGCALPGGPRKPPSPPQTAREPVCLPSPRSAPEEQHEGSLTG